MEKALGSYKAWVKRHPGVVSNLDWLLYLSVWSPSRIGGSEASYEAWHALVGLLSLWHQNILEEDELPMPRPSTYLWLDALEQVETLVELRAMYLESQGKMSRYGPLVVLETVKAVLKMAAWSRYSGHVFLRRPSPDDLHQFESEQGLQDILASLDRLRSKYTAAADAAGPTAGAAAAAAAAGAQPGCVPGSFVLRAGPPSGRAAAAPSGAGRGAQAGACEEAAAAQAGGQGRQAGAGDGVGCSAGGAAAAAPACGWGEAQGCGAQGVDRAGCAAAGAAAGCGAGCGAGGRGQGGRGQQQSYGAADYLREQLGGLLGGVCGAGAGATCGSAIDGSTGGATDGGAPAGRWSWRPLAGAGGCGAPAAGCGAAQGGARWGQGQDTGCGAGAQGSAAGAGVRGAAAGCGAAAASAPAAPEDPDAHMGRNLLWLSELLHIWRPVVYVTLLKRYGRRSWRPWCVSAAIDALSSHFRHRGRQHLAAAAARAAVAAVAADAAAAAGQGAGDAAGGAAAAAAGAGPQAHRPAAGRGALGGTSLLGLALARSLASPGLTPGEERELGERRRKLLLYALRPPFLEATTLSWLGALRSRTARVPLLGSAADYVYGLVDTFTAYYSYTSGSN